MSRTWTADQIGDIARGFQQAAILCAAAELDVFNALAGGALSAQELAGRIGGDPRATTILADALAAMDLLDKSDGRYRLAGGVADALTDAGPHKCLAMTRHQASLIRRWAQLPFVVKTGQPAQKTPSTRGAEGDNQSFIEAMDEISHGPADGLVASLGELKFTCLLDVGGGSGTYTIAFLRRYGDARGLIFDLPDVIPMARARIAAAGLADRVALVAGDLFTDPLPMGADLIFISAIIHMLSRDECRMLYRKAFAALPAGGQVLIRDIVMRADHVQPMGGAIFAVNMLTGTAGGGTYSLDEIREDLESVGFAGVQQIRSDPWMDNFVIARRPATETQRRREGKREGRVRRTGKR